MRCSAVVLAGGSGRRMRSDKAKQYMEIGGFPVLYYSLKAFQDSFIDEIILVTGSGRFLDTGPDEPVPEDEALYCRREMVDRYGFDKVKAIVTGGKERYHSAAAGLAAVSPDTDYVFIHDAARPCISREVLDRALETVVEYGTAIVSVPSKDTVKLADKDGFVTATPARDSVYIMQTPQVFAFGAIKKAYEELIENEEALIREGVSITDDAMVMERFGTLRIKLSPGDYRNIKLTTPEDIRVAEGYLQEEL